MTLVTRVGGNVPFESDLAEKRDYFVTTKKDNRRSDHSPRLAISLSFLAISCELELCQLVSLTDELSRNHCHVIRQCHCRLPLIK